MASDADDTDVSGSRSRNVSVEEDGDDLTGLLGASLGGGGGSISTGGVSGDMTTGGTSTSTLRAAKRRMSDRLKSMDLDTSAGAEQWWLDDDVDNDDDNSGGGGGGGQSMSASAAVVAAGRRRPLGEGCGGGGSGSEGTAMSTVHHRQESGNLDDMFALARSRSCNDNGGSPGSLAAGRLPGSEGNLLTAHFTSGADQFHSTDEMRGFDVKGDLAAFGVLSEEGDDVQGNGARARLLSSNGPAPRSRAQQPSSVEDAGRALDFGRWVTVLRAPSAESIRATLRMFMWTVIGAEADRQHEHSLWRADAKNPPEDYQHKGFKDLRQRLNNVCTQLSSFMSGHELFETKWYGGQQEGGEAQRRAAPAELTAALRGHTERYIMNALHGDAWKRCLTRSAKEDADLGRRTRAIASFLTPECLEIPSEVNNDIVTALAGQELAKINTFKVPADKVRCIISSANVVFRALGLAGARSTGAAAGKSKVGTSADDFLPVYIWVVLQSHVPHLAANCEYIEAHHDPSLLRSRAGYALVNLRSAINFILTMQGQSICSADANSPRARAPGALDAATFDANFADAMEGLAPH